MAYNKKNWQDNVSDITAAELNRIEQGIYDNSLVVDAVTNTLNPKDTETYKTAELTEGQITDVIGVNDIVIKGQTEQDEEPTPSAPVDVNMVSGSNIIRTNNKNLLPNNAQSTTQNGVTFTVNKDKSIKINGTASANTDIYLYGGTTDTGNYLHIPQGAYSLSTPDSKFYYIAREKTKGALVGNSSILQALAADDCYFYGFFIRANQNSVFNNFVIKPQLEKGSTTTTYEPHQGKELPLDLLVGNLAYIEEKNKYRKYSTGAFQETPYFDSYIAKVIPNVTYATKSLSDAVDYSNLCYFDENMQYLSGEVFSTEVRTRTFTTPANCGYVTIAVPHTITQFMLVKGTVEDIKPIELCKIGDYQDYFYRDNSKGKWYLHKETFKTIIPSSVNGIMQNSNKRFFVNKTQIGNYNILNTSSPSQTFGLYCDILKEVTAGQTWSGTQGISYDYNTSSGTVGFDFAINGLTTVAEYQEALAGKIIIAKLNTPTDTEITNTTLISQLEAIYNAPLYEETNITQTNNNLPMVLDITACKDNINGIKAFIRK